MTKTAGPVDLASSRSRVAQLAHLRNRPGCRVQLGDVDRLDRIDDQQVRLDDADMFEDCLQVGLGDQEKVCREF